MGPGQRWLLLSAGLGLAVVGSCFVIRDQLRQTYAAYPPLDLPQRRCAGRTLFDAKVWQDDSLAHSAAAPRGCMVDDLLRSRRLERLDSAGVVALLGTPRPTAYFVGADFVYWLGPERGSMAIDSEWLIITLDSKGRVAKASLATD